MFSDVSELSIKTNLHKLTEPAIQTLIHTHKLTEPAIQTPIHTHKLRQPTIETLIHTPIRTNDTLWGKCIVGKIRAS